MSFSNEWDLCYADNLHMSVWPWSDIVSLVNRYCKQSLKKEQKLSVLELGCGAGANIPFFQKLGTDYYGIDGSSTIVERLHRDFPALVDHIIHGDFTTNALFKKRFDLVIDRASLTHNTTSDIKSVLLSMPLKEGGIYIGVDWFSTNHSDYIEGERADDIFTRKNINKGQFVGVGKVHFSDEMHIRELFHKFEILLMEEKVVRQYEPLNKNQFASWNIVAKRPL